MDENFIFSSNNVEVSEDVKGNLMLDFILCDFSTNANDKKINSMIGKMLPVSGNT